MFPLQITTSAAEPLVLTGNPEVMAFIRSPHFRRADATHFLYNLIHCTQWMAKQPLREEKDHLEGCAHRDLLANANQLRLE